MVILIFILVIGIGIYVYFSMQPHQKKMTDEEADKAIAEMSKRNDQTRKLPEQLDTVNLSLTADTPLSSLGVNSNNVNMSMYSDRTVSFGNASRYYILGVSFNPNIVTTTTQKSNVKRAVVGAVIAGPVGAVIGAARKPKIETATTEQSAPLYVRLTNSKTYNPFTISVLGNSALANGFQAITTDEDHLIIN